MLQLIDSKSHHAILPELDLQSMPGSQVGVEGCRWTRINLKNTLTSASTGPYEFQLASNSKSYINLRRSWIVWNYNITDAQNRKIPEMDNTAVPPVKNINYAAVNGIAGAIGRQYILHINSEIVESSSVNSAYRYYIENELNLSSDVKNSSMSVAGYFSEVIHENEESEGYKARVEMSALGKECQVACRLSLDLANQNRLLPSFLDIRLTMYTNNNQFLIDEWQAQTKRGLKLNIKDAYVLLCEYTMDSGYTNALEKYLLNNRIQYPLNAVQLRSVFIGAGRADSPHFVAFSTHSPKRVTVGIVSAASFNGSYGKSFSNFENYDLTNLTIEVGGVSYPGRPWNLNYKGGIYSQAYISTLEALGMARSSEANSITMDDFANGWCLYSVELSPSVHDPDLFDLIKPSNVTVRMEFGTAIPAGGVYAIILGEFDSILSIDGNRNPHIDSIL